jgi:hypothetical protein
MATLALCLHVSVRAWLFLSAVILTKWLHPHAVHFPQPINTYMATQGSAQLSQHTKVPRA